jgi:hypothetical protein
MDLPARPQSTPPRGNWLGLLLAAAAGTVIFTGLIFLTGGVLAYVLAVAGGIFALAAMHYVVWGWWLSKVLYEEESAAEDEQRAAKAQDDGLIRREARP